MNAKVNAPSSSTITVSFLVRGMDFDFYQVTRYWAAQDAALTHFMTALSALFPDGEKFFVHSV